MSATLALLRLVPKSALSHWVGAVCRAPVPAPLVRAAIRTFARTTGVNASESERPIDSYRTFAEFFTRRLKPGLRPIAPGALPVSPVDGTVGQGGRIGRGQLVQAKGREYTVAGLVGGSDGPAQAERFEGGTFVTVYLAPWNYHRIHAPLEGSVTGYTAVPGTLWPVNREAVERIDKLFCVNERLTTWLSTARGPCAVVAVGATNVGRIRALYADVVTNEKATRVPERVDLPAPVPVARGGELAIFEMGSTVVLLFQQPFELRAELTPGTPIRMGEALGREP
jgi:phosphatidylserine decarboxylase